MQQNRTLFPRIYLYNTIRKFIKCINFTYFLDEVVFHKQTVSKEFRANCPKISANSQFMESFLARKLGEASVFYTACYFYHIQWTHFLTTGIGYGSSTLGTQSWERTPNIKYLNLFYEFLFLGQGVFCLLQNELPITLCACHYFFSVRSF